MESQVLRLHAQCPVATWSSWLPIGWPRIMGRFHHRRESWATMGPGALVPAPEGLC